MKCNRCGKEIPWCRTVRTSEKDYYLCEDCHKELQKFLAGAVLQYQEQYGYITIMYEGENYYAD